jgi:hypothetical protein
MVAWGRFDNRMLQVKKQLRAAGHEFCRAFPLLYSIFPKEEFSGRSHRGRSQPPNAQTLGKK